MQDYNHDFAACFNTHPGDKARRRCLLQHSYGAKMCPEMKNVSTHCISASYCNLIASCSTSVHLSVDTPYSAKLAINTAPDDFFYYQSAFCAIFTASESSLLIEPTQPDTSMLLPCLFLPCTCLLSFPSTERQLLQGRRLPYDTQPV
jgi:hypothetical protein